MNLAAGPGVITTPASGVITRLHTHKPTITSDTLKTATLYYGDPNVQIWQSDFSYLDELTITADASSTDAVMMSLTGQANPMVEVAAPAFPAQTIGSLLMPSTLQAWIDTASAIGTTEITGRVVSSEFSLTNNIATKYIGTGPTGGTTFSRIGRGRPDISATVQMEVIDTTQLDMMLAATAVKLRVRVSGDAIETVAGPITYYNYVQWDVYGKLKFDGWADLEGTNRTANFRIDTVYDATLGADWQVVIQNTSAVI